MQTKAGGQKMIATVKEKYGVDKDGKSLHHIRVGTIGGSRNVPKGFARMPREKVQAAGKRGGTVSKRKAL